MSTGGKLFLLITENGTEKIIRSTASLFEIANELKTKAKVEFHTAAGEKWTVKSEDVRSIENMPPHPRDFSLE